MSNYRDAGIQCPFYTAHLERARGREICCEGITEGGHLTQVFATRRGRDRHLEVFCSGRYECCEIYRAVMEAKYSGE